MKVRRGSCSHDHRRRVGVGSLAVLVAVAAGSCKGPTGPEGTAGAQGQPGTAGVVGPAGSQGPAGRDGVSGYQLVSTSADYANVGYFNAQTVTASCPAGAKALGGGYELTNWPGSGGGLVVTVVANGPLSDGSGWRVALNTNTYVNGMTITVTAVCAAV